jgi:3-oxoacyl-[acyl-carrier protein] reductase
MMQRRSGRIVTIGSLAGCEGATDICTYHVAKAAVHMYSRCLAHQLRPHNVAVNCVAPGPISTERWRALWSDGYQQDMEDVDTLDRVASPSELAAFIGFLCSPRGSYLSGQVIRFDGGRQLFPC